MVRIVRKSRERLLEERYEAQLAERERVIRLLAAQVENLLAQRGRPIAAISNAALTPPPPMDFSDLPEEMKFEATNMLSDEEEELCAMLQAQVISRPEYDDAIERIKRRSPDDIIE